MKTNMNRNAFIEAFKKSDEYNNQFSPEALNLIFDYLEEIDENMDFDKVVAVKVGGKHVKYDNGKFAYSKMTVLPDEVQEGGLL